MRVGRRAPDLTARVGSVVLPAPILTASGTAGHGDELGAYVDLAALGAVVVKSLSADAWAGNPPPRLHAADAGMLNSVGLQNPGVAAWIDHELPPLLARGARVVASIWGRTVDDFARAADALAGLPPEVVAVEVNVSCPNLEDRSRMFAHHPESAAAAVAATAGCGRPRWAKLSPNIGDLVPIVDAVVGAGAEAVTLINTVMGLAIDPVSRRARLGNGGGGLSGPAIRPVAVRAVHEVHTARPEVPIVGVGGVARGEHAVELALAGASVVEVGTATFADPKAPATVLAEVERFCRRHGVATWQELVGAYEGPPGSQESRAGQTLMGSQDGGHRGG